MIKSDILENAVMIDSELPQKRDRFATTQWSIVASAGEPSSEASKLALQQLCQTYWMPLYGFARRKTQTAHEAQDLTQSFFVELLEKNYVGTAIPERGKFRSFLLTAFKNFMSKAWEKGRAQKRGGGQGHLSLDFQTADSQFEIHPDSGLTPEQYFDQQWVFALLAKILDRLAQEFQQAGHRDRFDQLKHFVIGDHSGLTYAVPADALGISVDAAKKAVSRMRARYRAILREQIAQTVATPDEIDAEISNLFAVLQTR